MEYMDAGSLDRFAGCPIPEPVLQRVTASIVKGLKFLKDELQTMHRGGYNYLFLSCLPDFEVPCLN